MTMTPGVRYRLGKHVWAVRTRAGHEIQGKGGGRLGLVTWYADWGCPVFEPDPRTVYSRDCLEDIARFLGSGEARGLQP